MATQPAEAFDPYVAPIELLDVSDPMIFHHNKQFAYFKRLRDEDPVHFCADSPYGPYWSITKYKDIMEVDTTPKVFSSFNAIPLNETRITGKSAVEGDEAIAIGGFIATDAPTHDEQRKIVSPAVAPTNLLRLESLIRTRTQGLLSTLPVGEEFDWVSAVSVELTTLMLATLLGWPLEAKQKLKRWSDAISGVPGDGVVESWEQRDSELREMSQAFVDLREQRRTEEARPDLISMLAHSPAAQDMSVREFTANVTLMIVGGNDTTRNSMSASIMAFHNNPDQWAKLLADPSLVDSGVPEIIRFHTPVMCQGRRALDDYQLGGKTIRKGDKVMMWYISGNRDESAIPDPEKFIIDRERPRQHLSFGFGIHRCLGNRLAEMQLRVLWEVITKMNWKRIEVTGPATYAISHSLRGIDHLPVRIHA